MGIKSKVYYSNHQSKDYAELLDFVDMEHTKDIKKANKVIIDLEKFIFKPKYSFANHYLNLKSLNIKLNELLKICNEIDENHPELKQERILIVRLVDIKSTTLDKVYRWSHYSHKFTASQGKDTKAMSAWHELENDLGPNIISAFKARRESNLALYVNIIKNHMFFNRIIFAKNRKPDANYGEYGLDVAEELYISKTIKEYAAQNICSINEASISTPLFFLLSDLVKTYKLNKLKAHAISNSRKLDLNVRMDIRAIFRGLNISEVPIEEADLVLLVNDLDLLSVIPELDTDKPIMVADLSLIESPSFGYLLLKDDGFGQIYSYSKKRANELPHSAIIRTLGAGLLSCARGEKFINQIATNYMDDYFLPLSKALNQPLKSFVNPINLLARRLEEEGQGIQLGSSNNDDNNEESETARTEESNDD